MTQRDWLTRERIETIKAVGFDRPFGRDSFMPSDLDTLCSMALAYLDATEWRPIETAPRDGTRVLVSNVEYGWAYESSWRRPLGGESDCEDACCRKAWCWESLTLAPTHWLPLPQPPKEKP